jgi:hypothetical protein
MKKCGMNTLSLTMQSKIIQATQPIITRHCLTPTQAHSLSPLNQTIRALALILNSSRIVKLRGRINSKYGTINLYPRLTWCHMYLKGIGGKKKKYLFLRLKFLLINVLLLINRLTLLHSSKKRRINNSPWLWILVAKCAMKHSEK